MDTAHAQPDPPQPLGATLRRSAHDRVLLGLCAGIARSAGLSPLAVRLGTIVVSFLLLPFVLLAYTVAAVIIPRDDGAALVGTGWRDRRDVWIALALTLLAAPAALGAGDGAAPWNHHFGFAFFPLAVLTGLALLAVHRQGERDARKATPWTPPAPAHPAAPAQPSAPTEPATTTKVFPAAQATAPTAIVGTDAPSAAEPMTAESADAAGAAGAFGAPATEPPRTEEPPSATFVRPPAQPPQDPEAPRRPGLTLPVLAAIAAVPAIFGMLLASGAVDAEASSFAVALAAMAVVSAAGAVTIAITRPSYLGPGLLVLLAAALGIASIGVGQFGSVLDDGVGERHYRVTDPAELSTPFVLGAGQLDIDLRTLRLQPRERVMVKARLGFGEMNVAVPEGVRVVTTRESSASELTVTARENGAAASASAAAPTIVLDLRARGVDARVVTGRERDLTNLDVLSETSLGFWNGRRSNAPFVSGALGPLVSGAGPVVSGALRLGGAG